jgi:hypothetical protein
MTNDVSDADRLRSWAAQLQNLSPENGLSDDMLNAVARVDAAGREAAKTLPFEAEPAGYTRLLERLADKVTPS